MDGLTCPSRPRRPTDTAALPVSIDINCRRARLHVTSIHPTNASRVAHRGHPKPICRTMHQNAHPVDVVDVPYFDALR